MTVRVHTSERSRHLVIQMAGGEALPQALAARLNDEQVACGWLRASGVLSDVELQAFDGRLGRLGEVRRLGGPVHVIALEGSIGLVDGAPAFSLRAVLARESDRGLETLAGEIVSARAVAFEALVTALDDLALPRTTAAGVGLLDPAVRANDAALPAVPAVRSASSILPARSGASPTLSALSPASSPSPVSPPSPASWASAAELSSQVDRDATNQMRAAATIQMPQRPTRPEVDLDVPFPEPGDVVDHFAFGRADVIKSDGDRLHLRVHKDGRIREIALEMLRVTRLEGDGPGRRFKLERRL